MLRLRGKRGFTLVELLASVAILALVAGPVIHYFLASARTAKRGYEVGDATLAAVNIIETFKANSNSNSAALEPGTIALPGYEAGGSAFDVRVIVDADGFAEVNGRDIPVYSPMDAVYFLPPESPLDAVIDIAELLDAEPSPPVDADADALNVYVFYSGVDNTDSITVDNPDGVELNLFAVNQGEVPPDYRLNIHADSPVKVFANTPYHLWSDSFDQLVDDFALVDTFNRERMFKVRVEVYPLGKLGEGRPLVMQAAILE